jgi:hypothetical protein
LNQDWQRNRNRVREILEARDIAEDVSHYQRKWRKCKAKMGEDASITQVEIVICGDQNVDGQAKRLCKIKRYRP